MKFRIVQSVDKDQWNHFIQTNPDANIFQSPEMFELFDRVEGHQSELWAAVDEQGEIYALLPYVNVTLMDGMMSGLTTRSVAYGGVLYHSTPEGKQALQELLQTYGKERKGNTLFTELRNLHDLSPVQPILQDCGFVYEDHLNYLIDLDRPAKEVMQSMGKSTRKGIRREGRKNRVHMEEVSQAEDLKDWYQLLKKTYAFAQVPLADLSLFQAAFEILYPKGMIKFLVARIEGNIAAVSAELLFKDIIYGWYSGTDRDFSSYIPNEMLMWHILEWGAENDYRVYDFGGAGKPDEDYGVRDFKAKFGGDLVNFGRNIYLHRPKVLKLSKFGYELYRRLM